MTERNWLLVTGACAFVAFLVARLPAAVAVGWLAPDSVQLNAPTGTLWSGGASGITVGSLRLGQTSWSISPLAVLRGQLRGDVEVRIGEGRASGTVARGLSGAVSCYDCGFEGPASALWPLFPVLKAVTGRLAMNVTVLEVRDRWPTRAVATAKLTSSLGGQAGAAAAFEAAVNADPVADDGNIEASIQDAGGPVQLTARLTITPPGNFQFAGRLKAGPGASPEVVSAVAAMGARASDGSTELALTGSF